MLNPGIDKVEVKARLVGEPGQMSMRAFVRVTLRLSNSSAIERDIAVVPPPAMYTVGGAIVQQDAWNAIEHSLSIVIQQVCEEYAGTVILARNNRMALSARDMARIDGSMEYEMAKRLTEGDREDPKKGIQGEESSK